MATQRLSFLYPHMFQPASLRTSAIRIPRTRIGHQQEPRRESRSISSTNVRKEQTVPQRYGTAQEPQPPPSSIPAKSEKKSEDQSLAEVMEKGVKAPAAKEAEKQDPDPALAAGPKEARKPSFSELKRPTEPDSDTTSQREPAKAAPPPPPSPIQTMGQMADALHKRQANQSSEPGQTLQSLEKVFAMPAPAVENAPPPHPHLAPPRYVHHFDSYTLVKNLQSGSWTPEQSITLMKAVRGLLSVNLDVAQSGLVSKSDVENETYLFRAACSELRTEILNTRRATSTTQRTQLHHLQHTADILSQRVSQETSSLKDDLKGMLNDRRMASREQSQQRDSEISELNYRISARLIGDTRSDVEGLRWTLTRRAAIGIAGMAVLILGSLRYGSYRKHEMEVEARRKEVEAEREKGRREGGGGGGGSGEARYTQPSREMGTQTDDGEGDVSVKAREGVGYVSLG